MYRISLACLFIFLQFLSLSLSFMILTFLRVQIRCVIERFLIWLCLISLPDEIRVMHGGQHTIQFKVCPFGVSGWLSQLSNRLLVSAQVMISTICEFEPHIRLCGDSVGSLLGILSPSLSLPLPHLLSSLSLKNKQTNEHKKILKRVLAKGLHLEDQDVYLPMSDGDFHAV